MEFSLSINIDNAAFGDYPEVEIARILREFADDITCYTRNLDDTSMVDINGNKVGKTKVEG